MKDELPRERRRRLRTGSRGNAAAAMTFSIASILCLWGAGIGILAGSYRAAWAALGFPAFRVLAFLFMPPTTRGKKETKAGEPPAVPGASSTPNRE